MAEADHPIPQPSEFKQRLRAGLLAGQRFLYRDLLRPLIFRQDAQTAHANVLRLMAAWDERPAALRALHRLAFMARPVEVGGVMMEAPLMLAAGLVKGHGFVDEVSALAAVARGENIIPGWRSLPALVGPVEFGSFTRWPRLGNPGNVLWRDTASRSTQNRVGLKNPGAAAAAAFLGARALPTVYGLNLAVSPGVDDPDQQAEEVVGMARLFLAAGLAPAWVTLNISCPNTEDDPGDHQTAAGARGLCRALTAVLNNRPLWVKISPELSDSQLETLLRVFADEGVRAVIATNTLAQPAPGLVGVTAGVGGARLHAAALRVTAALAAEKRRRGYTAVDLIGCGGVQNAPTARAFLELGARAVQYWSALVFEGPLAAASALMDL